jgi:hypothetical protein
MADAREIGSACAEYQRVFIESRLWRNASHTKEQHAADTSRWWLLDSPEFQARQRADIILPGHPRNEGTPTSGSPNMSRSGQAESGL